MWLLSRYREDVFRVGEVGGRCNLNGEQLKSEGDHKSPLQSWSDFTLYDKAVYGFVN